MANMSTIVFARDSVTVTLADLFALLTSARDATLGDLALTFRTGFKDASVTDLDKYRASMLKHAAELDAKYLAVVNSLQGAEQRGATDIKTLCLGMLRTMSRKDKWAATYTNGMPVEFPDDVLEKARLALAAM